ncbi:MAG: ABC-2 type transport system ATP-binding protein [Polyangiales bacterium]
MTEHSIEVESLRKEFGSFTAVRDVSFHVEKGEIFGYLGANGAGKSTTIRMLCGLLEPTSGRATVGGHDVGSAPRDVKRAIGYMSQKFSLYLDLSARQNLEFFAGSYGLRGRTRAARIDEVMELAGLKQHSRELAGAMPGGTRQRLALASALVHKPQIVFLDEPTAGVDPLARRQFWSLIRNLAHEGTTVFVTTHYMDEAEYCARVGLMVDGELRALDTPKGLKAEFVPGTMLSVEGAALHQGMKAVRALPNVIDVESFGAGLHVRIETSQNVPDFRHSMDAALRSTGAQPERVEQIEATLEDVFLSVVAPNTPQAPPEDASLESSGGADLKAARGE